MLSAPHSTQKQAEIDGLAQAIRQDVKWELNQLAAHLATTTDDAHLFGDTKALIAISTV